MSWNKVSRDFGRSSRSCDRKQAQRSRSPGLPFCTWFRAWTTRVTQELKGMVSEVEQQYQDCIDSVNQAPSPDSMSLDDKAATCCCNRKS